MLGITEVIDNLYISGLESRQAILNKGIRCVINISSECPKQDLGPTIEYEKVNILDLPTTSIQPYFDRLTDRIHENLQQGKKTLVHCYVGRSRSATIILAYLMKYKQMSLREAFHYLRSRRHIIGPNFGFIKQLIAYEKSLCGYTTVQFVNTSFGSVPDIYLSMSSPRPRRQMTTTTAPIQTINSYTLGRTLSSPKPPPPTTTVNPPSTRSSFLYSSSPSLTLPTRQHSAVNRSITSALPARSTTTVSNYANTFNHGVNSNRNRPLSSFPAYENSNLTTGTNGYRSSLNIRPPPEISRANSTLTKPFDLTREYFIPTKINTIRTVKYVPSSYNRYYLP
jgi:atypical dual specificity phosphatase